MQWRNVSILRKERKKAEDADLAKIFAAKTLNITFPEKGPLGVFFLSLLQRITISLGLFLCSAFVANKSPHAGRGGQNATTVCR